VSDARFVRDDSLAELLAILPGGRKVANALSDGTAAWAALDEAPPEDVLAGLRSARPFYSAKSVMLPASEVVARYGRADADPLDDACQSGMAVIGARGCECRALAYLDRIMLDEPLAEPFYEARRANTTIVSVDCAEAAESCFCNLLGQPAYAEGGFDLNLSPVEGGFLVEAGSEKGEQALAEAASVLSDPTVEQRAERDAVRARTAEQLARQNAEYAFPEDFASALPATLEEMLWRTELAECVQCGGCTAVCPQCYCFLLSDGEVGEGSYERARRWDSCQFTGYSQMAGPPGTVKPDPRRDHMSKFQHRFAHKFWYNPLTLGVVGCVGCGRCRDTCPGAIDLRRVLSEVNKQPASHG